MPYVRTKDGKEVQVHWEPTGTEEVHDLYVDRRLVEYDVHTEHREDALRRARVQRR